MSDTLIERIKHSHKKRLVLLCEGVEIKSIKFWRSVEQNFGGEMFFGIDQSSKNKKTINVFLFTDAKESDVFIDGLTAYLSWQTNLTEDTFTDNEQLDV